MSPELSPSALSEHLDRLLRAAWAMTGTREDAEDLVQETCLRVLRRSRTLGHESEAVPYLLGVLRNTWIDMVRSRARRPSTPIDTEAAGSLEAPTSSGPDEQVAAREVFAQVAALPDEFRDAVTAVDVVGLSYSEAAELLDVPLGTVMSRLSRGRERVAEALG